MNLLSKCALALRVCVLILCSFGFGTAGAVIPVQYQCADSWVAYNNPRFDACSAEETCRKGADYMRRPFLGFHYSQSGAQHCILDDPREFWWVQFVPGRGGDAYCPPGAELSFTYNWGGWPSCHCPVGTTEQNGQCVGPAEIKLSGPTQALPVDAGGQALRIKATVTQGGSPKTASPVTVFIQPSAGGSISVLSAVTNASGEVLIDYTPPATMPVQRRLMFFALTAQVQQVRQHGHQRAGSPRPAGHPPNLPCQPGPGNGVSDPAGLGHQGAQAYRLAGRCTAWPEPYAPLRQPLERGARRSGWGRPGATTTRTASLARAPSHLPAAWWPSVMGRSARSSTPASWATWTPMLAVYGNALPTPGARPLSRLSIPTCTHRDGHRQPGHHDQHTRAFWSTVPATTANGCLTGRQAWS